MTTIVVWPLGLWQPLNLLSPQYSWAYFVQENQKYQHLKSEHLVCIIKVLFMFIFVLQARKNREISSLQRRIDEVPSRAELSQYQRRFVELYNQGNTCLSIYSALHTKWIHPSALFSPFSLVKIANFKSR